MDDTLIRACKGEQAGHTPIWLMRQAGRYIPEYRRLRKEHSMMEICKTPELSSAISAMPVAMFGLDAAIIFQDILVPLEAIGIPFRLVDNVGPIIESPLRNQDGLNMIKEYDPDAVGFVSDAIRSLKDKVGVPVIGFAGGPFTVACYLIEGMHSGKFTATLRVMKSMPRLWGELMDKLTDMTIRYLNAQADAGADVLQLFDTWAGMLGKADYAAHVNPYVSRIFRSIKMAVPKIHFTLNSSSIIDVIAANGCDVVGIGWQDGLIDSWSRIKFSKPMQGNLSPHVLAQGGASLLAEATAMLKSVGGRRGYIFNLGHGVLPETRPESVRELAELVHSYRMNTE